MLKPCKVKVYYTISLPGIELNVHLSNRISLFKEEKTATYLENILNMAAWQPKVLRNHLKAPETALENFLFRHHHVNIPTLTFFFFIVENFVIPWNRQLL